MSIDRLTTFQNGISLDNKSAIYTGIVNPNESPGIEIGRASCRER